MPTLDEMLATIETIHAAGLDSALWPQALAALSNTVGGNAGSLEVCDQRTVQHLEMYSYGLPGAEEIAFLPEFPKLNIRLPFVTRLPLNALCWDYMILDETAMRRQPFYAEIMPRFDIRYFVGCIVMNTASEFAIFAAHRPARMGHVQRDGIETMRLLAPHVRQAFDLTRRLRGAEAARAALERALDQLADGAALLRADGMVTYANESFQAIARRNDGIRLLKGMIELADSAARERLGAAMASVLKLRAGKPQAAASADFGVVRTAGDKTCLEPYLMSVRPLLGSSAAASAQAVAIVFVRNPVARSTVATDALRERFGFTAAEAALADALQRGVTPADYARSQALSRNTVYTHLRQLREKTGCSRMVELIHKLSELRPPLLRG